MRIQYHSEKPIAYTIRKSRETPSVPSTIIISSFNGGESLMTKLDEVKVWVESEPAISKWLASFKNPSTRINYTIADADVPRVYWPKRRRLSR